MIYIKFQVWGLWKASMVAQGALSPYLEKWSGSHEWEMQWTTRARQKPQKQGKRTWAWGWKDRPPHAFSPSGPRGEGSSHMFLTFLWARFLYIKLLKTVFLLLVKWILQRRRDSQSQSSWIQRCCPASLPRTWSPCGEAVEELYTQTPFVVPSNLLAFCVRMFGFVRRFPVEVMEGKLKRLPYDNRTDTESTVLSCVPSAVKMSWDQEGTGGLRHAADLTALPSN